LTPECLPIPETLQAITDADAIIIGPGSLYTSIIPNLLVNGVADAIARSNAVTFYISNIMTELGETDGFDAADHLRVIVEHIGQQLIDFVIVNTGAIDEPRLSRYREEQAIPVSSFRDEIGAMGIKVIEGDLVSDDRVAWHDSEKLAYMIMKTLHG